MLLVVDVGNTNIVIGLMEGPQVQHQWRITTGSRTTDEVGLTLLQLMRHHGVDPGEVHGAAISCVVPSTLYALEKGIRRYLDLPSLVVGRGTRTGVKVRMDNPREVGADRIVNAVAAIQAYGAPVIIVDFGTATTFDCVGADGAYVGGVIAPGYQISAEALFQRTSKLPRVELERPKKVIGTNTVHSMQAGLFWGYVGLVDGIAARCKQELGEGVPCIATGGLANLIAQDSAQIHRVDDTLTLRGLQILWDLNHRDS
ncbi:MAG: type III pantothenate kinase [Pseudomonadota bacterium]